MQETLPYEVESFDKSPKWLTEDGFPFPPQFPKRCGCGRVHTEADWASLTELGPVFDDFETQSMRNCPCGSTLSVIVRRHREDEELEPALTAPSEDWECVCGNPRCARGSCLTEPRGEPEGIEEELDDCLACDGSGLIHERERIIDPLVTRRCSRCQGTGRGR